MKSIVYKSLRVFLSKKMEIANKLPFVPYNNFHFENIKRYRIFRPHPYYKLRIYMACYQMIRNIRHMKIIV